MRPVVELIVVVEDAPVIEIDPLIVDDDVTVPVKDPDVAVIAPVIVALDAYKLPSS